MQKGEECRVRFSPPHAESRAWGPATRRAWREVTGIAQVTHPERATPGLFRLKKADGRFDAYICQPKEMSMGWFERILPVRQDTLDLAHRVATECQMHVWQSIAPRAGLLNSLGEAQGYVRARAKGVLRGRLSDTVVRGRRLSAACQRRTLTLALDLIAARFTRVLLYAGPQPGGRRDGRAPGC